MLLAAGVGSRLRPLTDTLPKCMVPLADKPVLLRNIEWLRGHGINEVAINLHYRPEVVKGYFEDGSAFGVNIHYSHEPELLGTAGALLGVRNWLGETSFLIVFADNLHRMDLETFLETHRASDAAMTMALLHRPDVSESGVATLGESDMVTGFVEKPVNTAGVGNWVNAGVFAARPSLFRFIPPGRVSDFGRDVIPSMLAAGELIAGHRLVDVDQVPYWIDTHQDLERTESALARPGALE